ncbi:hypothetical protein CDIK_0844 [Cucumispora dikerogammari]|nr:hypothetical protein CDIK_0844 [Cucumispora dikerogammari]
MSTFTNFYKSLKQLFSPTTLTDQILEDIQNNQITECLPKYLKNINTKNILEKKLLNHVFRSSNDINKLFLVNTNIYGFTSEDIELQIEAVSSAFFIDEVGLYLSEYIFNFIKTELASKINIFKRKEYKTIENFNVFKADSKPESINNKSLIAFDAFNLIILSSKDSKTLYSLHNELISKIILFLCSDNFLRGSSKKYNASIDILMNIFKYYPFSPTIEEAIYIGLFMLSTWRSIRMNILNFFLFKNFLHDEKYNIATGSISIIKKTESRYKSPIIDSSMELNELLILLIEKNIPYELIDCQLINKLLITVDSSIFERSFLAAKLLLNVFNTRSCYCLQKKHSVLPYSNYPYEESNEKSNTQNFKDSTSQKVVIKDETKPRFKITHQEIFNKLMKFQNDSDFEIIYTLPFHNITKIMFFKSDPFRITLKKLDLLSTNLKICSKCFKKALIQKEVTEENYKIEIYDRLFYINLLNLEELKHFISPNTIYLVLSILLRHDIKCDLLLELFEIFKASVNIQTLNKIILINKGYIRKNKSVINDFYKDFFPFNINLSFIDDFLSLYSEKILYSLNGCVNYIWKKVIIEKTDIPKCTELRFLKFCKTLSLKDFLNETVFSKTVSSEEFEDMEEFDNPEFEDPEEKDVLFEKSSIVPKTPTLLMKPFEHVAGQTNIIASSISNKESQKNDEHKIETHSLQIEFLQEKKLQEQTHETLKVAGLIVEELIPKNTEAEVQNITEDENVILTKYPYKGRLQATSPLNDVKIQIILEKTFLKTKLFAQPQKNARFSFSENNKTYSFDTSKTQTRTITIGEVEKTFQFDFICENNQKKIIAPIKFRINIYKTVFISDKTYKSKYYNFGIRRFDDLFVDFPFSFKISEKNSRLMGLKYLDEEKCLSEVLGNLVIGKRKGKEFVFKTKEKSVFLLFDQKR